MTDENYKVILEKYNSLKEQQKQVQEAEERLHDLVEERLMYESNPMVQGYLQVMTSIKETAKLANQKVETDEDFFNTIANTFYGNTDTNNIYVYMGRFANGTYSDIVHGSSIVRLPEVGYQTIGWIEYKNIESHYSEATIQVKKAEQADFEKKNIVLYAPLESDKEDFYQLVRKTFFQNLVLYGQEDAVRRILEEFKPTEEYQKFILARFMKRG